MKYFLQFALITTIGLSAGCSATKTEEVRSPAASATPAPPVPTSETKCDPKLWDHVYNPSRLEVLDTCKTVTGVVEEVGQNEDGDTHLLLRLDAGQEDLLRKRNLKKKDGNLVVEFVCANEITDKKAENACVGFVNRIAIPNVGDHVSVTGTYVLDTHNDWTEIHPVSQIESR